MRCRFTSASKAKEVNPPAKDLVTRRAKVVAKVLEMANALVVANLAISNANALKVTLVRLAVVEEAHLHNS